MMYSVRKKILWFAISTRIAVIIGQAFFNSILPDHEPRVFKSPQEKGAEESQGLLNTLLGGLDRWDGQYFLHIAQYGYTYEQCLAFQPLFPALTRMSGALLWKLWTASPITINIPWRCTLLLSATILNTFFFVKSALALHSLSLRILKSEALAYKAAILYCVNPASIFFTAPYSESLFAWLSFSAMLESLGPETLRFTNVRLSSGFPVALSMVTRANGVLNIGFILYASLKSVAERTIPDIVRKYRSVKRKVVVPLLLLPLGASFMALLFVLIVCLAPWLMLQVYNYFKFCMPHEHNLPEHLLGDEWVLPGTAEGAWCNYTPPLAYSYIQQHYWDVGFLKYYHWKQIPNFLLAAPVLSIILVNCYYFYCQNTEHCRRLGVSISNFRRTASCDSATSRSIRSVKSQVDTPYYDPDMFVYIVHGLFVSIFCILFVHIQVATRMLCSSSPLLYWFLALRIKPSPSKMVNQNHINEHFRRISSTGRVSGDFFTVANLEGVDNMFSKWRTFILSNNINDTNFKLIKLYFLGYFIIGIICFSNYFPWT